MKVGTRFGTPPIFESLTAEIVTACIRAGQDPNVRDNNNATPLHKASYSTRDPAVIAALLAGGAGPECPQLGWNDGPSYSREQQSESGDSRRPGGGRGPM